MTAESSTWQIERIWSATTETKTEELNTPELSRFRGLILLGVAGAGKTTEASRLADQERLAGASVHWCRLAEFAESSTELRQHLAEQSRGANERTVLYLDALDEAMIPSRGRWLAIRRWVTEDLAGTGASIRITCRSAVWPSELTQVVGELVGSESFTTAVLQPLTDADIHAAANSQGIAPAAFLEQIHSSGARSLANQPLSLHMLMRLHQSSHGLPASLRDLFQNGLELLASDPEHRHEIDTHNPLPPTELLEAAERLACYMILGGHDAVHVGDEPPLNQLGRQDLAAAINLRKLDAIRQSGLSDSTSPASFRFAHRQFVEYLAGRRLGQLPTHQARVLLAGADGWSAGVAGPLRETAAFAAMFNPDVARWIATTDPDVIGLSDIADPGLRRAATLDLLDRFRRGDLTAAQLHSGDLEFKGLRYPDAPADLQTLLTSRGDGCNDVLECAIELARSWQLSSLSDDLAALVLDSSVAMHARVAAGYALGDCGHSTARQRLTSLIAGSPEDADDELKGVALRCLWPNHLAIPDLLSALARPRRPTLYGAYQSFLVELDREEFAATGHLATGLRWAQHHASDSADNDIMHRIAMRIAQAALRDLDDPVVSCELTALIKEWARQHTSPPCVASDGLPARPLARRAAGQGAVARESWPTTSADRPLGERPADPAAHDDDRALYPGPPQHRGLPLAPGPSLRRTIPEDRPGELPALGMAAPWETSSENVDAWLRVCDDEPVKSILGNQRWTELASDQARSSASAGRCRSIDPGSRRLAGWIHHRVDE